MSPESHHIHGDSERLTHLGQNPSTMLLNLEANRRQQGNKAARQSLREENTFRFTAPPILARQHRPSWPETREKWLQLAPPSHGCKPRPETQRSLAGFHDAIGQPETAPWIRFANITTLRLLVDCWILHGPSTAPASLTPQSENTNIQHPRPPHTVGCVLSQTHSAGRTARATLAPMGFIGFLERIGLTKKKGNSSGGMR